MNNRSQACLDAGVLDHAAYCRQSYFPVLDGVRALCVLLVITVHTYDAAQLWSWLAGARGVTVFFVLSGYLITLLGLREEQQHGRVRLAAFYVRRGCRILPLYFVTLGLYCVLILGLKLAPSQEEPLRHALPFYLLYLQEVPFFVWVVESGAEMPFFHSWSLGVEEKFYLVWPWLAFVLWQAQPWRRLRGTALLTLVLAATALALGLTPAGRSWGRWLSGFVSILAGCVLAQLLHERIWFERLRFLGRCTGLVGLAFLACHFATPWLWTPLPVQLLNLLYTSTATALLGCLVLGRGPVQRLLCSQPLLFVGRLSYGTYLLHVLGMTAVYRVLPLAPGIGRGVLTYALTCGVTLAGAWLLAVLVEKPFIELGRAWSRRLLAAQESSQAIQAPSQPLSVRGDARRQRAGWASAPRPFG